MVEPWFELGKFGALYGSIVGGGGGTLCGLLGALSGSLAPRGVGRPWIVGSMYLMVAVGISQLAFGAYAWFAEQPWGIYYGPLLAGFILSVVMGSLIPVVKLRYRQAEERRLEAAALRSE